MAGRLDTLIQLLFRELLYLGKVQMLTKEWWNVHDETEQFVMRLQATSPTDMAFIKPEDVEAQLYQHSVDALANWTTLQGRLSHLAFLRNALQQHHTASTTLECPTCLQAQSPSRPTFVLLAGCWHSLCLPCHQRIQANSVSSQRRCPLCRKPFETAASNAMKRRPLTLLHFDGGGRKLQSMQEETKDEIPIKGDHSSKIQEVIRCLKRIKLEDVGAKAVVFSSVGFYPILSSWHTLVDLRATNHRSSPGTEWNHLHKSLKATGWRLDAVSVCWIPCLGPLDTASVGSQWPEPHRGESSTACRSCPQSWSWGSSHCKAPSNWANTVRFCFFYACSPLDCSSSMQNMLRVNGYLN